MAPQWPFGDAVLRLTSDDTKLRAGMDRAEKRGEQYAERLNRMHTRVSEHHSRSIDTMNNGWKRFHDRAASMFTSLENRAAQAAAKITRTMAGLGIGAAAGAGAGAFGILKLGANAVESENLFNVSMGKMADAARKWSIEYSKALRLNEFETRKNMGTFDVFLKSMGMGEERALQWSGALTKLTNDISSFYNISRSDAFEKIMSGASGNSLEPLRALGINLSENATKAYALAHGMVDVSDAQAKAKIKLMELDQRQANLDKQKHQTLGAKMGVGQRLDRGKSLKLEQDILNAQRDETIKAAGAQGQLNFELNDTTKLYARMGLLMERTKAAQGDLARTLNSPLNILRGVWDELKGAFAKVGMKFFEQGTPLNNLMIKIAGWADRLTKTLNDWADSDGPTRLQNKIAAMWESGKKKVTDFFQLVKSKWKAVKEWAAAAWEKIYAFSKSYTNMIEGFWERNQKWLRPLITIWGAARIGMAAKQLFGGGQADQAGPGAAGSDDESSGPRIKTPLVRIKAEKVEILAAAMAAGGTNAGGSMWGSLLQRIPLLGRFVSPGLSPGLSAISSSGGALLHPVHAFEEWEKKHPILSFIMKLSELQHKSHHAAHGIAGIFEPLLGGFKRQALAIAGLGGLAYYLSQNKASAANAIDPLAGGAAASPGTPGGLPWSAPHSTAGSAAPYSAPKAGQVMFDANAVRAHMLGYAWNRLARFSNSIMRTATFDKATIENKADWDRFYGSNLGGRQGSETEDAYLVPPNRRPAFNAALALQQMPGESQSDFLARRGAAIEHALYGASKHKKGTYTGQDHLRAISGGMTADRRGGWLNRAHKLIHARTGSGDYSRDYLHQHWSALNSRHADSRGGWLGRRAIARASHNMGDETGGGLGRYENKFVTAQQENSEMIGRACAREICRVLKPASGLFMLNKAGIEFGDMLGGS